MKVYPKIYLNNVREISIEFLKENKIKGLILDVDNTLIDLEKNMPKGTKKWCEELKQEGIQFCILSNSNKKEKIEKIGKELGIKYFYFAMKPLKRGFKKAVKYFYEKNIEIENIAVVGDQIFTDILGANRMKLYPILVEPIIVEKDY